MPQPLPFPGLATPAAGFDQPFEMLGACHDRVRRTLGLLQRLVDHLALHGADAQARSAAGDVLRYFDVAAPAHHEDEERHVIPRLLASDDERDRAVGQRLRSDHALMHADWQALRMLLQGLRDGEAPDGDALRPLASTFASRYAEHLVLEDSHAFPRTEAQVRREGDDVLRRMGEDMADRRGARRPASAP